MNEWAQFLCQFKEALISSTELLHWQFICLPKVTNDICPSLAQTTIPTSFFDLELLELFLRWLIYASLLNQGIKT